jgi:menaquinone-dependent protoporphyrinogen oxidase
MGRVASEVGKFVSRHAAGLTKVPVAAFTVGMLPVAGDMARVDAAQKSLMAAMIPVRPVSTTLFAGKLDPDKLSFLSRKLIGFVKSPVGDHRDWNAIAAWARELPQKMGV